MGTRPDSPREQAPAMDSDEGDEPGRDTAADSQGDTPTTVVDLTDQSGPARRFYANLADL